MDSINVVLFLRMQGMDGITKRWMMVANLGEGESPMSGLLEYLEPLRLVPMQLVDYRCLLNGVVAVVEAFEDVGGPFCG